MRVAGLFVLLYARYSVALIESIPSSFRLNRIVGGRDVVKLAAIVGVDKVMKRREFHAPDAQTS